MYNKTTWQSGDTITATKLNNIENGLADGGVLFININDQGVMDKTWQQIHDAPFAVARNGNNIFVIAAIAEQSGTFGVALLDLINAGNTPTSFVTNSADGYPVYGDVPPQ